MAALDQVSGPVAAALLEAARGLARGIPDDADEQTRAAALAAHGRLVAHLEEAAAGEGPDTALGAAGLTALMGSAEGMALDLGRLAEQSRRRTGPAAQPARRQLCPDRPGQAAA